MAGYDLDKLDASHLGELVHLFGEGGDSKQAVTAGRAWVKRFGAANPQQAPAIRRVLALAVLSGGSDGIDEAIANFQASITDKTSAAESLDSLAQLIRLLGIRRNQPDKSPALLKRVHDVAVNAKPPLTQDAVAKVSYRRAINAAGDVALWHGNKTEALEFYRRVEVLRGRIIPKAVRSARIGSFPNSIREYLQQNNYGAAIETVDRWEDQFATEKVKGHTFFWRGLALGLRGQQLEASEFLDLALALGAGAIWESQARWRLAVALEETGRASRARAELAKLAATGIQDRWTGLAREKLKKAAGGKKGNTP